MSYNASLTGAGWLVDPIINPKSGLPAPGYTATLTGSGYIVDPIPKPETLDVQLSNFISALSDAKFWADLSLSAARFQNFAGTTAVTADGQPFARINDRAGSSNGLGTSVAASMPMYRTDGVLHWAQADGVDDFWQSLAPLDLSATSQATVIAGVRKESDASTAVICEHSASFGNVGTFALNGPTSPGFDNFGATINTGAIKSAVNAAGQVSPASRVVTGVFDGTADPSAKLRVNGVQTSSQATASGSAKFLSATLNVFRRNATSNPFTGRLYGLIVIGRLLSASELSLCERWMASKTGVTL